LCRAKDALLPRANPYSLTTTFDRPTPTKTRPRARSLLSPCTHSHSPPSHIQYITSFETLNQKGRKGREAYGSGCVQSNSAAYRRLDRFKSCRVCEGSVLGFQSSCSGQRFEGREANLPCLWWGVVAGRGKGINDNSPHSRVVREGDPERVDASARGSRGCSRGGEEEPEETETGLHCG
jgi:hypothetical protein